MVEARKILIAAAFIVVVLIAAAVVAPSLLSLGVTSVGPLYPRSVVNEAYTGPMKNFGNWETPESLEGGYGDAWHYLMAPIFIPLGSSYTFSYVKATNYGVAVSSSTAVSGVKLTLTTFFLDCQDFGVIMTTQLGLGKKMSDMKIVDLCSQAPSILGGEQDTWGLTLTGADISNPTFGVWVNAICTSKTSTSLGAAPVVHINRIALTFYTSGGQGAEPFTISLGINPSSGKSATPITATVHTNPMQVGTSLRLQVNRAGSLGAWQDIYSGTTDITGSIVQTWTPQDYGLTADGTYSYRVMSQDGLIISNQVLYIQSDPPIPPPEETPLDWTNTAAIALLIGTVVVIFAGIYLYRRRH